MVNRNHGRVDPSNAVQSHEDTSSHWMHSVVRSQCRLASVSVMRLERRSWNIIHADAAVLTGFGLQGRQVDLLVQGRQVDLLVRRCHNLVATRLEQPPMSGTLWVLLAGKSVEVLNYQNAATWLAVRVSSWLAVRVSSCSVWRRCRYQGREVTSPSGVGLLTPHDFNLW